MATDIKCPSCGTIINVENVLAADIEQKLQQQYQDKLQQSLNKVEEEKKKLSADQALFEEKKKNENEIFAQKLQQEKQKMETEIQEQLRKSISSDYENKLRLLEHNKIENEEKLKEARKKELEFLQKEQELKNKEAEFEITLQKKIHEERALISEQVKSQEAEKNNLKETTYQLKLKELELQLDEQKKLADEMKRRSEQSSMQRQGEAQEILLEEILETSFPFDKVSEVPKGKKGADCLLTVRNKFGQECGTILFESKRTSTWGKDWIDKLKQDIANSGADTGILISQALPDTMTEKFELRDGIWVCGFSEFKLLTASLREGLIQVQNANRKQEGKGDKIQMLYDYMTSNEFALQWKNIRDVFKNMQQSVQREREVMEKLWKNREKQLERALLNSDHIVGSIEGIAGKDSIDMNLLNDIADESPDQ